MKILPVIACVLFAINLGYSRAQLIDLPEPPVPLEPMPLILPDDLPEAQAELNEALAAGADKNSNLPEVGMPKIPLPQLARWNILKTLESSKIQGSDCTPGSPNQIRVAICPVECECTSGKWHCTFNVCPEILGIAKMGFDMRK